MCLIVKADKAVEKIAEKNILCYKRLRGWESIHNHYQYKPFKRNPEVSLISYPQSFNYKGFSAGYHSWVEEPGSNSLFIIPKGAIYYTGWDNYHGGGDMPDDAYVSSQIIFVWKNNWFGRLLLKLIYGIKLEKS